MNEQCSGSGVGDSKARQRRLELARQAFREFKAQCFWSAPQDLEVTEADIPFIIRGLRLHGGHKGYRIVTELCR
jgi:hypothetical protein